MVFLPPHSQESLLSHCDGIFSHKKIQVLPYTHLIEYISSKQQYIFLNIYIYIYIFNKNGYYYATKVCFY